MFIGRTDVEAETSILWLPHAKSWLIWKDPEAEKGWGQEEKGMTEAEMVGWHHWLNEHEFGWTLGVGDGQGCLACCGSWGQKESDMTEWLNWTDAEDVGLIPGSGGSPGEGNGNPLQNSCERSHGQRSVVGYSPQGHKRVDTTEWLNDSTVLGGQQNTSVIHTQVPFLPPDSLFPIQDTT